MATLIYAHSEENGEAQCRAAGPNARGHAIMAVWMWSGPGPNGVRRPSSRWRTTPHSQARLSTVFSYVAPGTVMFHFSVQL